ncbi:MAG: shikimate kinase [Dehalococcoidales bacterium]|nr:shikimate kinase [Dehalococcoidales bacterium]
MKTSIALIGFMGTGKTAVGRILAAKLGKRFIELDELIEKRAGKSINDIFRGGEIAFREMEIAAVKEVAGKKNQVIACGGGIVLNRINIDRLKQESITVLLTASPTVILKRTSTSNNRPLLNIGDRLQNIRGLLKFRKSFYDSAADLEINTTRLSIEDIADRIIEKLRQDESFTV